MLNGPGANAAIYTDLKGLRALKAGADANAPETVKAVAQQFEAMFLQTILKGMRDASLADGLLDSDQGDLYEDMYDKQLALTLSQGKGLGLTELLVRQLSGHEAALDATPPVPLASVTRPPDLVSATAVAAPVRSASQAEAVDVPFTTPQAFVDTLLPLARQAGAQMGVAPGVLLAQAALETGWGKAVARRPDGSSSYNLFNIKADARWNGERVAVQTLEYKDGVAARERGVFRAYGSYEESFQDYVNFIQSNDRYQAALQVASEGGRYLQALQDGGYATDPRYADKVLEIAQRAVIQVAAPNGKGFVATADKRG